jgi:hypothetical protein
MQVKVRRASIRQKAGGPESGLDILTGRTPMQMRGIECRTFSPVPANLGSFDMRLFTSHVVSALLAYFNFIDNNSKQIGC